MKIAFLSVWFSDKMGYIENCLPKAMAKLGHDVHIITSTAQVYFYVGNYKEVYEPYLGPKMLEPGTTIIDGVKVHRLPSFCIYNKVFFRGLKPALKEIDPDVVQTFDTSDLATVKAASYKKHLHFNLYTANHIVASVFPPLMAKHRKNFLFNIYYFLAGRLPGMYVNEKTSRCFPATIDALQIAVEYFGVDRKKCRLAPLGVDTDYFYPPSPGSAERRSELRKELGFLENDIVCIYTGRFTVGKNPLVLAKAIDRLTREGYPVKGLFLGKGPQSLEIESCKGCIVHEFVPYHELLPFYHIADIGVWPRQESTSMLDAAACGLPIIVSDKVQATERFEGNGIVYKDNDPDDLSIKILSLLNMELRRKLSDTGMKKIRENFSWEHIARERVKLYDEDMVS
jgi:glycosyltransferase involved in cell wall biosynthesis